MNDRILRSLALALLGGATALAGAATLSVPHTFQPGTPAKADEVNANFSAVQDAINDNDARLTGLEASVLTAGIKVSVAGNILGLFVSIGPRFEMPPQPDSNVQPPVPAIITDTSGFTVMSSKGYLFAIVAAPNNYVPVMERAHEGEITPVPVMYLTANCSGSPYYVLGPDTNAPMASTVGYSGRWILRQGFVAGAIDPSDPNGSYYIPAGAAEQTIVGASVRVQTRSAPGATCVTLNPTQTVQAVALLPNDPAVTGVPRSAAGAVRLVP